MDAEETIFLELVQTLLNDPAKKEHFFQVPTPLLFYGKYISNVVNLLLLLKPIFVTCNKNTGPNLFYIAM